MSGARSAADIEAIERATLAAVSPAEVEALGEWLLPFDTGTIGRARSAVPLRHDRCDPDRIPDIEAHYRAKGGRAAFRLAGDARLEPLRAALRARGYRDEQPTLVMTATCAAMRGVSDAAPAGTTVRPDAAWAGVFLGEGFDPVDGVHRVKALGRAADARYASVCEGGETLAVGVVAFAHGWASVHGMRTAASRRGQGLARRVLAGLAQAALERGIGRVFLQVEEGNAPARALYRRAGFEPAWDYLYWRRPA